MTVSNSNFKVDCKIDGEWFSNDLVFPDRERAKAYGVVLRDCGAVEQFRLIPTGAPVRLPVDEGNGEESSEDEDDDDDDEDAGENAFCCASDLVDWDLLLQLTVLCPLACFFGRNDDNHSSGLERIYATCAITQQGEGWYAS
jgi:hypothetical protein